jgi:MFS family permease
MGVDLRLDLGARYSVITLVFFFTYVFLQPPATVILRKMGPQIFLPSICIAWGILTIGFGFVHQWWEMIPLRLVLGVLEAGFFPGELNTPSLKLRRVILTSIDRLRIPALLLVSTL